MAKKKPQAEFKMSEVIREILAANPKLSSKEASDAVVAKYPDATINKNSFSVAFYTARKKLGIGSSGRGKKSIKKVGKKLGRPAARQTVDLAMMQATAKFLSEVGGAEAAMEAIKQVQAVQVK